MSRIQASPVALSPLSGVGACETDWRSEQREVYCRRGDERMKMAKFPGERRRPPKGAPKHIFNAPQALVQPKAIADRCRRDGSARTASFSRAINSPVYGAAAGPPVPSGKRKCLAVGTDARRPPGSELGMMTWTRASDDNNSLRSRWIEELDLLLPRQLVRLEARVATWTSRRPHRI